MQTLIVWQVRGLAGTRRGSPGAAVRRRVRRRVAPTLLGFVGAVMFFKVVHLKILEMQLLTQIFLQELMLEKLGK